MRIQVNNVEEDSLSVCANSFTPVFIEILLSLDQSAIVMTPLASVVTPDPVIVIGDDDALRFTPFLCPNHKASLDGASTLAISITSSLYSRDDSNGRATNDLDQ